MFQRTAKETNKSHTQYTTNFEELGGPSKEEGGDLKCQE